MNLSWLPLPAPNRHRAANFSLPPSKLRGGKVFTSCARLLSFWWLFSALAKWPFPALQRKNITLYTMCYTSKNICVMLGQIHRWLVPNCNGDMGIKRIIWCITKFGNYDILAPYSSNNHYLRWIQTKPLASPLLERLQQSSFLLTPKCLILLQLTGGWTGPWWIAHDADRHRVKQSRRPAQQRTRTPQRRGRIPPQSAVSWLRAQANICWMY